MNETYKSIFKFRIYRDCITKLPRITQETDEKLEYINEVVYEDEEKAINAAMFYFKMEANLCYSTK